MFTSIAYPCIVVAEKTRHVRHHELPQPESLERLLSAPDRSVRAHTWSPIADLQAFPDIFDRDAHALAQRDLTPDGWRLESLVSLRLLERLRRAGTPLGEYVQGRFYRGIVTGLNDAFVVDRATRDRLIAEHPSSADVLKPFLRGRDVKRWRCEYQDLWLIFTRRGCDIRKYPAVHAYLKQFKDRLMPGVPGGRKPGNYQWYEIQDNIAYWQEFEQSKIVYPDIAVDARFAVNKDAIYPDCTLFLIPEASPLILATLNSAINRYFFPQICPQIRGGFMRFKSIYVEQIPVPPATIAQQRWCERLADALIWLHEPAAGTSGDAPIASMKAYFEQWLNGLVYELFFPDELHARKLTLFNETARLNPPDLAKLPDARKLDRLRDLFERASDSDATLRAMLFSLHSLDVVRIIEGAGNPSF